MDKFWPFFNADHLLKRKIERVSESNVHWSHFSEPIYKIDLTEIVFSSKSEASTR